MRPDAGHGELSPKCLQNFDNFSKVTLGSHLQNENHLWKRERGQFNTEQKDDIRRKSNKERKVQVWSECLPAP